MTGYLLNNKLLYVDADTLLYSSAAKEEQNKCLAKHVPTGREKLFDSKTDFNNWLKFSPKRKKEDFQFENIKELTGNIQFACHSFKLKIQNILDAVPHSDYFVCIQGDGNFRKSVEAKYVQYKAQRGEKPLLFQELYDWVKVKYKHRCIVVDGEETDDFVVRQVYAGNIVACCDKDIVANSVGYLFNYLKPEFGVFYNSDEDRWRKFWSQCLHGDSGDNIDGIIQLSKATKQRYGITTNGVGEVAAKKILNDCKSEKEAAERVLDAYKEAWTEDGFERLKEMSFFLHMRRYEGQMFSLEECFDKLGVEY